MNSMKSKIGFLRKLEEYCMTFSEKIKNLRIFFHLSVYYDIIQIVLKVKLNQNLYQFLRLMVNLFRSKKLLSVK